MELGSFIPYGQHEATISHISLADTFENLLGEPGASRRHPMPLALLPPRLPSASNPIPTLLRHLAYIGLPPFLNNPLFQPSSHTSTSICVQDRPRFSLWLAQIRRRTRTCASFPLLLFYPVGSRNPRSRPCARGCEITNARNLTNPTADDEELRDLLDQLWPRESTPKVAKIILCPSESRLRLHTLCCSPILLFGKCIRSSERILPFF